MRMYGVCMALGRRIYGVCRRCVVCAGVGVRCVWRWVCVCMACIGVCGYGVRCYGVGCTCVWRCVVNVVCTLCVSFYDVVSV